MKRNNRSLNYLIIIYVTLLTFGFYSCRCFKNNDKFNLIEKSIFSKEFQENFRLCKNKNKEILVYNDTEELTEFSFYKENNCSKKIIFSEINFKYDLNSRQVYNIGIVLFKYEKNLDWSRLSFVDLETNFCLKLKYDNKTQELLEVNRGSF